MIHLFTKCKFLSQRLEVASSSDRSNIDLSIGPHFDDNSEYFCVGTFEQKIDIVIWGYLTVGLLDIHNLAYWIVDIGYWVTFEVWATYLGLLAIV